MMPGDIRKGTVKNITDFGAFIDLNGIDGLLHITDMSWGRIGHPSEMLKVGQDIDVVVLDVNKEKERVSLGLKQKMANPWDSIETKFPVGTKVKGKVVNLVPYGAFVELEPGVEGLVHVTELSWTKRIAKPGDVLKQGQEIEAVVLGINRDEQKISLGIRQLEANPWDNAEQKYPTGTRVKGKIRNLTSYGAFIELEEGLDGMIHVSDISWTRKINHPSEVLKKGDEVEAAGARSGQGQPAHRARREAARHRSVGRTSTSSTRSATSSPARSPSSPASARSSACSTTLTASSTSRRSARSAWTRSRTCSRSARKSPRASSRLTGASAASASPSRPPTTSDEQLKDEQKLLDALKPGEDLVALQHAFDAADEAVKQD